MLTSKEKPDTKRLSMMPIREVVIFSVHDDSGSWLVREAECPRSLGICAMAGDKKIFLAAQHDASVDEPKPNEIFNVGTIVNTVQSLKPTRRQHQGAGGRRGVAPRWSPVSDEDGFFPRHRENLHPANRETGLRLDALVSRGTGLFEQYVKLSHESELMSRCSRQLSAVGTSPAGERHRRRQSAAHPRREAGAT